MQHYSSYKKDISDFLNNFLIEKKLESEDSYFSKDVFERLMPLVIGGKMLRGSLLINSYQKLAGKKFSKEVLKAAVSIELAQTGFLIHDDIIDQDSLRRGQATLHHQYAQRAQQKKYQQSAHTGTSLAICVGDIVFFLAFELLSGDLIKLFSQQLTRTAFGEMHDVELALTNGEDVTKDDILQMCLDKTSSYSVCLPLMAGAILAKQDRELVAQLNEVGKTLGLIFQIKDDELGLFGDQKKTGKPVGADIREGKKTLYYYYLLQELVDKKQISSAFGNKDLDKDGVGEMLELIEKHRVRELVSKDLLVLENKAQQQIKELSVPNELKEMLFQFAEMMAKRIR